MGTTFQIDDRSSALLNNNSLKGLNEGIDQTFSTLTQNFRNSGFITEVSQAFGNSFDAGELSIISQDLSTGQFDSLPTLEIRSSADLKGARGAFAAETNTIYLSAEFVGTNVGNPTQISTVLLEEVGHWLDSRINRFDAIGDEGAIFSALASGKTLSDQQLSQLKAEKDFLNLEIDGKIITAEAANDARDNLGLLSDKVDDVLAGVIAQVPTGALTGIPILGNLNTASYINQLFAGVIDTVQSIETTSVVKIRESLATAFNSLGILSDLDGDGDKDKDDIGLTQNNAEAIEFQFKLGKNFNESLSVANSFGLPTLGFSLNGGASTSFGVGLTVGFGVDKDGNVFLKTGSADEFQINLEGKLVNATNNPLTAQGKLGFLNLEGKDNGSQVKANFLADLTSGSQDVNGRVTLENIGTVNTAPTTKLTANADLKLSLNTGLGASQNDILPSIKTDFNLLGWQYDKNNPATPAPSVSLDNVTLDTGSFVKSFAGGILDSVKDVLEPIQSVLDPFVTPLPVLDLSFLDLASASLPQSTKDFIKGLETIAKFEIPNLSGEIPLGNFSLSGDARNTELKNSNPAAGFQAAAVGDSELKALRDALKPLEDIGFGFPLFDNVGVNTVNLLLGKPDVNLFSYQTPKFEFNANILLPKIPVFGPIYIKITPFANGSAQVKFGYDSFGLANDKLEDGFYVVRPDANSGNPNFKNSNVYGEGGITAEAGVSLGVVSFSVGGGIKLGLGFNVAQDLSEEFTLLDGTKEFRARGTDFLSQVATAPFCAFDLGGRLSAIIFGQMEIDLGFFSFTARLDLADITIVDFEAPKDCSGSDYFDGGEAEPDEKQRAALRGAGIIDRRGTDGNDILTIEHDGGTFDPDPKESSEEIILAGFPDVASDGEKDPNAYDNVTLIVIKGGKGNDTIQFINDVEAPGQVDGGEGDDFILTGEGNDFVTGGQGNDTLNGGEFDGGGNTAEYRLTNPNVGAIVNLTTGRATNDGFGTQDILINIQNVQGSNYNDSIAGNGEDNFLGGGMGNDALYGGAGEDILMAGEGADYIDGGADTDTITYLTAAAPIQVNLSSRNLFAFIAPDGITPLFLSPNSGQGGEANGDRIFNIENVSGSQYNDVIVAGDGGGIVDGYDGNDIIYAGVSEEELIGGNGVDWLSYKLSNVGVEISLKDSEGSEGYADSDELQTVVKEDGEVKNVTGNSFENLEGSEFNDGELQGDDGNNLIRGLGGNDIILAEGGNDSLIGGAGADSLNGGDGEDTAIYLNSFGSVDVNLSLQRGLLSDAQGDTLSGVENLIGSNFDDVLIGDAASNKIDPSLSGVNGDFVDGGGVVILPDIDTLRVDYSIDDRGTGLEGGFSGFGSGEIKRYTDNTKTTILDRVSFSNIERLEVAGTTSNDSIIGGSLNDYLSMSDGDDRVDGGKGNDTLYGDYGIDTLVKDFSGVTVDIVLESFSITTEAPNDTKSFAGATVRGFEIYENIITDSGNDTITQLDRVNNTFITNAGNDTVNAGIGFDFADGGDGDDLLIVDYSAQDFGSGMTLFATGKDFARRSIDPNNVEAPDLDRINFVNFERYQVIGTSQNDDIETGNSNDTIVANAGDDRVYANQGNDSLNGGSGNDFLVGTIARNDDLFVGDIDTLTGDTGADTFALGKSFDHSFYINAGSSDYAFITDFNPAEGDKIQLRNCGVAGESFDRGYTIQEFPAFGISYLYAERGQELIAVIGGAGALGLDLNNTAYFEYLGDPCPQPIRIG
jgi:Ca2+-binding RTX toxin-like protein